MEGRCVLILALILYVSLFAFYKDKYGPLCMFCIVVSGLYHGGLEAV